MRRGERCHHGSLEVECLLPLMKHQGTLVIAEDLRKPLMLGRLSIRTKWCRRSARFGHGVGSRLFDICHLPLTTHQRWCGTCHEISDRNEQDAVPLLQVTVNFHHVHQQGVDWVFVDHPCYQRPGEQICFAKRGCITITQLLAKDWGYLDHFGCQWPGAMSGPWHLEIQHLLVTNGFSATVHCLPYGIAGRCGAVHRARQRALDGSHRHVQHLQGCTRTTAGCSATPSSALRHRAHGNHT